VPGGRSSRPEPNRPPPGPSTIFLQNDLLAQASARIQARPDTKPDPDLKVRTALDRAAARIEGRFKEQPLVEAAIRKTVSNTYRDLGLFPDAQRQMERAVDLRHRVLGEEHRDTLSSMADLAKLFWYQGKYGQAEPLFIKVLEAERRTLGEEYPGTLATMDDLAVLYRDQGKYGQGRATVDQGPGGRAARAGRGALRHAGNDERFGGPVPGPRQVWAGRATVDQGPWRPSVACWARSTPTRWQR